MDTFSQTYSQRNTALKRVMVVITLLVVCSGAWAQKVHVDRNATGNGDGASWANAVTDLQSAIDLAATVANSSNPVQVWVKADTYKPTTGTDRTIRFKIKNYVEMYGGFDGSESSLSQRDIGKNLTVISGDIGVLDDRTDNSQGLFLIDASVNGPIFFDGFVIENAYDPSNVSTFGIITPESGATPTSVTFSNCTFSSNDVGFGSVLGYGSPSARFYSCKFLDNFGTAIWSTSAVEVYNSLFTGNVHSIYIQLGTVTVSNSTFASNSGNGLFLQNQGTPIASSIHNNIFWQNTGTDITVQGNASENITASNNLVQDAFTFGSNTITPDPQFTDAANGDFSISNCSPAVDQGDNSILPGSLTTDLAGNSRTFNGTIDLGAYENQITPLFFSAVEVGDAVCYGEATGQISVNAGGGTGPLPTYSKDGINFSSISVFQNLAAGSHTIYTTDGTCIYSEEFTVAEPAAVEFSFKTVEGVVGNKIEVTATGGVGPYRYSPNGVSYQSGNQLSINASGSYDIYVKDGNSCVATKSAYFTSSGNRVVFVDPDAAGTADGSSWANAFTDLQSAIDLAANSGSLDYPSQVWVKAGDYFPTTTTTQSITFIHKNYVGIYGGFAGSETALSQRNIDANVTRLSADIGVKNDSTDNSYGILTVGDLAADYALVDGLFFEGIYALSYSATSGAISMGGTANNLIINNCRFKHNLGHLGACVQANDANVNSTILVSNSSFITNGFFATSSYVGSAIVNRNQVHVSNSIFIENKSGSGGAFNLRPSGDLTLENCTLYNNSAGNSYGAINGTASGATLTINNSIIWGSTSGNGSSVGGITAINNSILDFGSSANTVIVEDPQFLDVANFDLSLKGCSPAINSGDNILITGSSALDFGGGGRVFDNTVDVGAHEYRFLPVSFSAATADDVTCNGGADGVITISASGGQGVIEYSIDGTSFSSNTVFSGLVPGDYTVYARELTEGCTISQSLVVNEPDLVVVTISAFTDITCHGEDDGTISGTVAGGTGSFVLKLNGTVLDATPVTSTFSFNSLAPGTYIVTAEDVNACTGTSTSVTISEPSALVLSLNASNLTCYQNGSGAIAASASGGTGALTYSIDGTNYQTSSDFTGLSVGDYTVTVKDSKGCSATADVSLTQPDEVLAVATTTEASCIGSLNGSVTIEVTNGVAPLSFSINGGAPQTSNVFDQLNPGTYSVAVSDANGCGPTLTDINVSATVVITPTATVTNVACHGTSTGAISLSPSGGAAPYEYSIDGINFAAGSEFTGLAAGAYSLTVKDANGCTAISEAVVTQPNVLTVEAGSISPTCTNGPDGSIDITAAGGTAPYSYSIDGADFQESNSFSGLAAGDYAVAVKDANGCVVEVAVAITAPNGFSVQATAADVTCSGLTDGSVSLQVTGPENASYSYSLDGESFQEAATFDGLAAGDYAFTVKNGSGCTVETTAVISSPSVLSLSLSEIGGAVAATAEGGTSPYTYSSNGTDFQESNLFDLTPGDYTITVKDANGCEATAQVSIELETGVGDDLFDQGIIAYPNPASHAITFNATTITTVRLFDLSGNRVLTVNNYRTRESIDLSHLVPGVVIVELELTTGERIKQRLIIER
ncbi:MAG: choice-of-anchor Q domain-containing protein [Imperialibacter sp.]|uniref:choice-of-anchor Q domain-containing protein n=1 Tax=Imperialibacter sp. TaxID=2038411 RepID=UPI0032EBEE4E